MQGDAPQLALATAKKLLAGAAQLALAAIRDDCGVTSGTECPFMTWLPSSAQNLSVLMSSFIINFE
jgi:hypothetical protein